MSAGRFVVERGRSCGQRGGIRGDYVEARTADVFTGPCFSNAEIFIYGNRAVMAWKVTEGSWNGVDLRGLCVAAAVNGTTTFSEDKPEMAKAVLIVDSKADARQRDALIAMAKELGGQRLCQVTAITTARMSLKLEDHPESPDSHEQHSTHGMPHSARASFWAAGVAKIVTRPLDERDHACGNEVIAYPPLSRSVELSRPTPSATSSRAMGSSPAGKTQLPQQLRRPLRPLTIEAMGYPAPKGSATRTRRKSGKSIVLPPEILGIEQRLLIHASDGLRLDVLRRDVRGRVPRAGVIQSVGSQASGAAGRRGRCSQRA